VVPASQVQPQASPSVPPEAVQVESHNGTDKNLQVFLQEVSKLAPVAKLKTPTKKAPTRQANEAPTVRRSGRLAVKSKSKGRKTAEELAQEILCNKLEGLPDPKCSKDQARDHLSKLLDAPILQEAMDAIEDLLKVIKLDNKKGALPTKAGNKVPSA
jgi:hypothetical protein